MSHNRSLPLHVHPEEDGCSEDALKAIDQAAVGLAVLVEAEGVKDLGGALEENNSILLPECECRYPDGDEAVLAEGQTELGMPGNLQGEFSIAALMKEHPFGWPFHW